ncbi:MAG: phytanoyl-CoA dioxygenase family protein [Shimia sp.]
MITDDQTNAFQRDGCVMIPGAFAAWVETIAEGIAQNMAAPGPYASENAVTEGRFFDDYCNWTRIPAFERIIRDSPAADLARRAMRSSKAQFFHDHVLVKESGTPKPTPWHQDGPYYFVEGAQTVSMWIPIDPVDTASLRLIAGSHLWVKPVRPVSWADDSDFYEGDHDFMPVPNPDTDTHRYDIRKWAMQPGDAVLFDFRTVHGARGNPSGARRRALSLRWVGDDARYVERPGRTSPPFPSHDMREGQTLREDWFPLL